MIPRAVQALAVLAVAASAVTPALGQQPPAANTPPQVLIFKDATDFSAQGRYEQAAEKLEQFLAGDTKDPKYFLQVEERYGAAVFLRLRNVLKWSDNRAEDQKAKNTVDTLIARHQEASRQVFGDPIRIRTLIRKLTSFREEKQFAEQQLQRAGVLALPEMLKEYRATNKPELQAAIVGLLPRMPVETVPAQIAALDNLSDSEKLQLLLAIAEREDILKLPANPETDFIPYLWAAASIPADAKSLLRDKAQELLARLFGPNAAETQPEAALTTLAEPIAAGKAIYRVQDPMGIPSGMVRLWTYDAATLSVKPRDVPRLVADEYYALRYLRMALARNPAYAPAQRLFTSFATERAVERAKFGDLSKSEPAVYQILAAAPTELLVELLETALAEKRTALALGMLQALADRAAKESSPNSAVVRALAYPDSRVQFAAAVALLRQPGQPTHGKQARVVEILRQALAADADGSGVGTRGRALIADTDPMRGESLASMFRSAGYASERFATGRLLVSRLSKASDYDMIVVDRHVVDPLLNDTLTQVLADTNASRRPVFVVASSGKPKPVPLEVLLLRLANLVAATDDGIIQAATGFEGSKPFQIVIPPPYVFNPEKPDKDRDEAKRNNVLERDRGLIGPSVDERKIGLTKAAESGQPLPPESSLLNLRLARLKRLVEAADLPAGPDLNERLALRLPQLVLAGMIAEFDVTPDTGPRTLDRLDQATRNLLARPELAAATTGIPDLGNLVRLMNQLEAKLTEAQREKYIRIQDRMIPTRLALPADTGRDLELEAKLAAQFKRLKSVRVLPEAISPEYLKADIEQAVQNPAELPRDAGERQAATKLAADLLRRMAVGEIPGYQVRPAEAELRAALRVDATADASAEAVATIGTKVAQNDLLNLALNPNRPVPLRTKAADAAIRNIQEFGKLAEGAIPAQLAQIAPTEADLTLRGKLGVLAQLLTGKPSDFGSVLQKFPVQLPALPGPVPPKNPPKGNGN